MKRMNELFPYIPIIYKNRERILNNESWAGAVIPCSSANDEEHHLGGLVEAWNNDRHNSLCGLGYNGNDMLLPKLRVCGNPAVAADAERGNANECYLTYVCTRCGYRHKEPCSPDDLHSFNEACSQHSCNKPADIDDVVNSLVAETMRCKLTTKALESILPKEYASTIAIYATRGRMQMSELVYTLECIAKQYIKSQDNMECTLLKAAFNYYAEEIYKQWHKYHLAEQLCRAERFEDKLKVVIGDCLYNPMNYTKYIENTEVLTSDMRLRYCVGFANKGYDQYVQSAVCRSEFERLIQET